MIKKQPKKRRINLFFHVIRQQCRTVEKFYDYSKLTCVDNFSKLNEFMIFSIISFWKRIVIWCKDLVTNGKKARRNDGV